MGIPVNGAGAGTIGAVGMQAGALLSLVLGTGCIIPLSSVAGSQSDGGSSSSSGGTNVNNNGIPAGPWTNETTNLAGLASGCGNLCLLSSRPDRDMLIAGIGSEGLWANTNGGTKWAQLGTAAGSAMITSRPSSIVYDPVNLNTFWVSGIYGTGAYRTDDNGGSFVQLGNISHIDLITVDFTDSKRQTLLAGGHESSTLLHSTDGGNTWVDIGPRVPAGAGDTSKPLIIDAQNYLLGTVAGMASGVFRSTNGGQSWTKVYAGGIFGPPLVAHDKNQTIYWLLDASAGMISSPDHGASWNVVTGSGAVSTNYSWATLTELPDGRLVTIGANNTLLITADGGMVWRPLGPTLPYTPVGDVYSEYRKALYIWHNDCSFAGNDPVLPDAVESSSFDYQKQ